MTSQLRRGGPGDRGRLEAVLGEMGVVPPADYLDFMEASDGGRGPVGTAYLDIWAVASLVELNKAYTLPSGIVAFGSNGGDAAYAFDTRGPRTMVVEVPFISIDPSEIRTIGASLADLFRHLSEPE